MYKTIDMDSLKLNQNFRWIVEKKTFQSRRMRRNEKVY